MVGFWSRDSSSKVTRDMAVCAALQHININNYTHRPAHVRSWQRPMATSHRLRNMIQKQLSGFAGSTQENWWVVAEELGGGSRTPPPFPPPGPSDMRWPQAEVPGNRRRLLRAHGLAVLPWSELQARASGAQLIVSNTLRAHCNDIHHGKLIWY